MTTDDTTPITIMVIAKDPMGGRCQLYSSYAEALKDALGAETGIVAGPDAPALTVDGTAIIPSDGVILSSDEIYDGLALAVLNLPADLLEILEDVETRFMEGLES